MERIGRWIDFDNDYKTLDPSFMESVWWVFSTLHKKGLVYQGFKVSTWACDTIHLAVCSFHYLVVLACLIAIFEPCDLHSTLPCVHSLLCSL